MELFYHGTSVLFDHFDLAHVLEGDGKVKFGYGVYITSSFASAAHYANPKADTHYVYTVEVPELTEENHIAFKQSVHPAILKRVKEQLGLEIPLESANDGKEFRKWLAKTLAGKTKKIRQNPVGG